MADLYISYFAGVAHGCASTPTGSEVVTTSGTSAASGTNANGAAVAMVFSDAAHYVTVGFAVGENDPEAAAGTSVFLPAGVAMWLALPINAQIAAITV
jgi:hypothetical protein